MNRRVLMWLMIGLIQAPRVEERPTLARAVESIAQVVAEELKRVDQASVALGDVTAAAALRTTAGVGVRAALKAALLRQKLTIDAKAPTELLAELLPPDPSVVPEARFGVRLRVRLRKGVDQPPLATIDRVVADEEEVTVLLGQNVDLKPRAKPEERRQVILARQATPSAVAGKDGIVRANADSPFGMRITRAEGKTRVPVATTAKSGIPQVELAKDAVFRIELRNDADFEAAVKVHLDGVSVFAFSQRGYEAWIVPPKSTFEVVGWHRTDAESEEFKVVPDGKGAVSELQDSSIKREGRGVISASFHASWSKGSEPPASENSGLNLEVGRGERVPLKTQGVAREVGRLRATVSIRFGDFD